MSQDIVGSQYEFTRLHNPWEKFTRRQEHKHRAENDIEFRLCRPLPGPHNAIPSTSLPTLPPKSTTEVIELFMSHGSHRLDDPVPRQRQLLKDFLNAVHRTNATSLNPISTHTYIIDVGLQSSPEDIALIVDRNYHNDCASKIGKTCTDCRVFSKQVLIPYLCDHLRDRRSTSHAHVDKRILFIPNLTPAGALALAATCATRSAIPTRDFLHRYLSRQHSFSAFTSWGFFLEFHLPYHAMRVGPIETLRDPRFVCGKRLRNSAPLPLRPNSSVEEDLYYHEAQTSSLSWGSDETFWTELFLVDTYFGSEKNLQNYLNTTQPDDPGDGWDPPLGGRWSLKVPMFDPREYFLRKVDRRIEQVTTEYIALVETFNKRMEEYATQLGIVFEDDRDRTNTQTLSNVIETIHIFVDCLSGIIDAWDTFSRTEMSLFTRHAADKLTWPAILMQITRNMSELDRLRRLLITKRESFKFTLVRLHTVSSLSQTETANVQASTAVSQGQDLKVLTQMTVYVAFPLLFTTAFFSMDFATPPKPWAVFSSVLFLVSLVNFMIASLANYMIASKSGPKKTLKDAGELCKKAWKELYTWLKEKIS